MLQLCSSMHLSFYPARNNIRTAGAVRQRAILLLILGIAGRRSVSWYVIDRLPVLRRHQNRSLAGLLTYSCFLSPSRLRPPLHQRWRTSFRRRLGEMSAVTDVVADCPLSLILQRTARPGKFYGGQPAFAKATADGDSGIISEPNWKIQQRELLPTHTAFPFHPQKVEPMLG